MSLVAVPEQNSERLVFRDDRRSSHITLNRIELLECRNPGSAKHRLREFTLVSQREPISTLQQSKRQRTLPCLSPCAEPVLSFDHICHLIASQRAVLIDRDDRREIIQWLGKRKTRNIACDVTAMQSNRQLSLDIDDVLI